MWIPRTSFQKLVKKIAKSINNFMIGWCNHKATQIINFSQDKDHLMTKDTRLNHFDLIAGLVEWVVLEVMNQLWFHYRKNLFITTLRFKVIILLLVVLVVVVVLYTQETSITTNTINLKENNYHPRYKEETTQQTTTIYYMSAKNSQYKFKRWEIEYKTSKIN